jgi:hypothetical protein
MFARHASLPPQELLKTQSIASTARDGQCRKDCAAKEGDSWHLHLHDIAVKLAAIVVATVSFAGHEQCGKPD